MTTEFERETFADLAGSTFRLTAADGQSLGAELVHVSETKETAKQRSFAIIFCLPEGVFADQGLYNVEHEALGPFQLFLVPIGRRDSRHELEAVFNYLKKGE